MRFIILRKADPDTEAGVMPSEDLLLEMGRYNEQLVNAGVMRDGMGLQPTAKGVRIRFSGGKPIVTDGPFAETKELIAGFTVIDVPSREEAIRWASQWPPMDGRGEAELEVRQVFELEDFQPGEGIDLHTGLGERITRQPALMNPYVVFDGRCREAFELYADCLGGKIEFVMTHGESPAAKETSSEWHDKVLHAELRAGSWTLMGSDRPPTHYAPPSGFAVQISIPSAERAETLFARLADGGVIQMPFEQTFWAYRFGMVTDRFGIPWMINCDNSA